MFRLFVRASFPRVIVLCLASQSLSWATSLSASSSSGGGSGLEILYMDVTVPFPAVVTEIHDDGRYYSSYFERPNELRREFCVKRVRAPGEGMVAFPHPLSDLRCPGPTSQIVVALLALECPR